MPLEMFVRSKFNQTWIEPKRLESMSFRLNEGKLIVQTDPDRRWFTEEQIHELRERNNEERVMWMLVNVLHKTEPHWSEHAPDFEWVLPKLSQIMLLSLKNWCVSCNQWGLIANWKKTTPDEDFQHSTRVETLKQCCALVAVQLYTVQFYTIKIQCNQIFMHLNDQNIRSTL